MQEFHRIKQRIEALSYQIKYMAKSSFRNINEETKRKSIINENFNYNLAEVIANIIIHVNFVDRSILKFQKIIDDYNYQYECALNYQYFLDNCLII